MVLLNTNFDEGLSLSNSLNIQLLIYPESPSLFYLFKEFQFEKIDLDHRTVLLLSHFLVCVLLVV